MPVEHRYLVCHRDQRDKLNTWLDHHPTLDVRGGGGDTFTIKWHVVGGNPNNNHYIASWKMPVDWFVTLLDEIDRRQWNVNTNDPLLWDFSFYTSSGWTPNEVLADTDRKPFVLEAIEEEV